MYKIKLTPLYQYRWSYLEVHTSSSYPDDLQSLAAGMVEGYLTADFILMNWKNTLATYCTQNKKLCDKLEIFLNENSIFLAAQIESNPLDPYWYQVSGSSLYIILFQYRNQLDNLVMLCKFKSLSLISSITTATVNTTTT